MKFHFAEAVRSGLYRLGQQLYRVGRGDVGAHGVAGKTRWLLGHEAFAVVGRGKPRQHIGRLTAGAIQMGKVRLQSRPRMEVAVDHRRAPQVRRLRRKLSPDDTSRRDRHHGSKKCSPIDSH